MSQFLKLALVVIILPMILAKEKVFKKEGPRGFPTNKSTSCEEFGKNARFNPYSIVGDLWFVFYYWAPTQGSMLYKFWIPSQIDRAYLHYLLDNHVKKDFNWSATMMLMEDQMDNITSLWVEKGDRGQYLFYPLQKDLPLGVLAEYREMRFKQTADNKYIAFTDCTTHTAFILSRINEIPPKTRLQDEAAKLGYHGRKGKSYLYQGSEWMPIPEADEKTYWDLRTGKKPDMEKWF